MTDTSPRRARRRDTRPVFTGIGVAAPNGLGTAAYWAATLDGKSGLGRITRFDAEHYPVRVAGEVSEFDDTEHVPSRLAVQTDHWSHLGLTAADWALRDAGLDPSALPEYEMAVVTASSSGGTEFGQREIEKLWSQGPGYVGVYQSIAWFYAATTGQISIRYGMRGPCGVICAEQAGGLDVLAQGRRLLRQQARVVVTGGTDASLCPYGLVAQISTGLLSTRDDPERAYLPFDADACGYVPGEGGAMLIMEDAATARERGARPYGALAGHGATFDPRPGPGHPPVSNLRRAITLALQDAGVEPGEVDVVFADALGVPERDRLEAQAISAVFGPHGVPVTAPKTMTGRLYAGGAPLDVATALLAVRDGVIPPTVGVRAAAPSYELDLVRSTARDGPVRNALVLATGHGGFNAALLLTAPDPS
ncbi:actinorhodin polyketide beta-ketoacyl synthase [Sphaerisporangium krabiense]|uniref:Act minimal PKS chain-length factor (CLF/KS beta) n=1 Tax=Sphaerisporangium krabiense TaxID=763782 RepID=A0A7W9DU74_9ACTN|nr:ketosynthase chain-length factor [Sphaerisporangium krabiense]MBB5631373.1 act minimal PKS chain-length factor (CLF/KS beta) [Sphaerisporangium krabiense]GII60790.1 actinorhodin polyketide beta-ketoacyl synthase [Sphaerisporangium krabiense]